MATTVPTVITMTEFFLFFCFSKKKKHLDSNMEICIKIWKENEVTYSVVAVDSVLYTHSIRRMLKILFLHQT